MEILGRDLGLSLDIVRAEAGMRAGARVGTRAKTEAKAGLRMGLGLARFGAKDGSWSSYRAVAWVWEIHRAGLGMKIWTRRWARR